MSSLSIGNNISDYSPGNAGETNPVSLKEQGNRLFREGDYRGAIAWYDMALFAEPGYRDALHNKRLCLLKLGLKDQACECTTLIDQLTESVPQSVNETAESLPSPDPISSAPSCIVCGRELETHTFTSGRRIYFHDPGTPCDTCGKPWGVHSCTCGHCGEQYCWDHVHPYRHYCREMPRPDRVVRYAQGFPLVIGILLIPLGFFLVAGNRSGVFPTFPFAGFITGTAGFLMVGYGLRG